MFFRKMFSRNEEKLKKEIVKKDNELTSLGFTVAAWQKIHDEDLQAIKDSQHEIAGLKFLIDKKDSEIEDLKEQIRWGDES